MSTGSFWALLVPAEKYATERLYQHDTLALAQDLPVGDEVLLVADVEPPVVFGTARVRDAGELAYTRRAFDPPLDAEALELDGVATPLAESAFRGAVAAFPPTMDRREWLVSVDLPIEAESAAEAVRQFWTHVTQLGPTELPAFVAPLGDELAMQAYVLGEETNLDPEEDEA
jgi:hypothetical protein